MTQPCATCLYNVLGAADYLHLFNVLSTSYRHVRGWRHNFMRCSPLLPLPRTAHLTLLLSLDSRFNFLNMWSSCNAKTCSQTLTMPKMHYNLMILSSARVVGAKLVLSWSANLYGSAWMSLCALLRRRHACHAQGFSSSRLRICVCMDGIHVHTGVRPKLTVILALHRRHRHQCPRLCQGQR